MNENINLCEILKDAQKGLKLWSPILGDVVFDKIKDKTAYPVLASNAYGCRCFTKEGKYLYGVENSECVLFPSREQRDWSKFVLPKPQPAKKITWHVIKG